MKVFWFFQINSERFDPATPPSRENSNATPIPTLRRRYIKAEDGFGTKSGLGYQYFVPFMVFIHDGSWDNGAHVWSKIVHSWKKNSYRITKCLQQIKIPILLHVCAPCSEIPSKKNTTVRSQPWKNPKIK